MSTRMNWIRQFLHALGLLIFLALAACGTPPAPADPTGVAPAGVTQQTVMPPAGHRIAVRRGAAGMEFYNRDTGEQFIPRGANYHRWVERNAPGKGTIPIDALFNTQFGELDMAEAELQQMAALGFNTVRVWTSACWGGVPGCMGNPAGGLSPVYLDNVTKFLQMAKRHGIYVIFTDDSVPEQGGYTQELNRGCCTQFDGYNTYYLSEHGIAATRMYWQDFIKGLIQRGAPLDAILAYELKNEAFYELQLPPLNRSSGTVTTANGKTYDMASQQDRRRMVEEGWLYWSEQLRNAIRDIDPTALVTMGFFVQQEPHPVRQGDTRLVYLERMMRESQLDFLDFHAYPGYDLNIQEHAENLAMTGQQNKLILMGEFGADKRNYSTPERAAAALQAWQLDSCELGFDGWLLWTWGHNPGDEFWNASDGGGLLGTALAPTQRPDPCQYGQSSAIQYNAASRATITASSFVGEYPPERVVDGTWEHWNASGGAPQWVELALPSPVEVQSIGLTVAQDPPGRSVHELWIRQAGGELQLVHTFDGVTADGDVLTFQPEPPLADVDLVRVVTTSLKDLWPAWREIEIFTSTPPR